MTRARKPRSWEVQAARQDPRLQQARQADPDAEGWRNQARCADPYVDPEWFYPLPTEPADMALAVCRRCPVQPECLAAALTVETTAGTYGADGVWGATTARERRAMLAAWRQLGGRIRQAVT